ncbi:MAG: ComEC/Rec2 family competence protein [Candidatus Nomurabacteria bacterium]|jgi:competence protein ComEC|nr:ComEC/Rec2 family competence protein [Candidatus Nomurabacteria bacterium]
MLHKIHPSFLFLAFLCTIILGVGFCFLFQPSSFTHFLWLILAIILLLVSLGFSRKIFFVTIIFAGFLLGTFRTNFSLQDQKILTQFVGQTLTISGTVYEDIDEKSSGIAVRLNNLEIKNPEKTESQKIQADLYITISNKQLTIKRGDILTINGKLSDGFGSFAASVKFAQVIQIVEPVPGDVARQLRDNFGEKIKAHIKSPEADLSLGYLLGQKSALPMNLMDALLVVGLTHMIVASGYNLTILVRLARKIFSKISRFSVLLFGIILIIAFSAVTGFGASIMRAAIVSILSLLFWYRNRKSHPINLLIFVAALTLLLNPTYLINLGWLLSFASFAGIMLLSPLLTKYFYGEKPPKTIPALLIETMSAFLFTLPIILSFSGHFSIASLPANLIIGPTIPIAMLLTFLTGIFAIFIPPLATITGFLAEKLLSFHIWLIHQFEQFSFLHFQLTFNLPAVIIFYAILILIMIYLWKKTGLVFREINLIETNKIELP